MSRRIGHLAGTCAKICCFLAGAGLFVSVPGSSFPIGPDTVQFVDVATEVGLNAVSYCGGEEEKKYIVETLGSGVGLFDYNNDGWPDVFLPNASRLEGFPDGERPIDRLFRNDGDGTFSDVSEQAGVAGKGWGQGVCAGDFDNDGLIDFYVTHWGENVLYRNRGDGTFADVTDRSGTGSSRWGTSCSFFDYDRDGRLDLFVANYVDFQPADAPAPGSSDHCVWRGVPVMCGPIGLKGELNQLFRNNGDGSFTDVSERAGITSPGRRYSLSATTLDYDQNGWTDLYVAVDSQANILYRNNGDGTFTDVALQAGVAYNEAGEPQAGMGSDAGDYDGDGRLDLITTNFEGETWALYRAMEGNAFVDATYPAGLGLDPGLLGWGTVFFDYDNDGWLDLVIANGHVYPEVERVHPSFPFRQRKVLYRNLQNGKFQDVTARSGRALMKAFSSRGLAAGDSDNDGDLDVLVNNMHALPSLFENRGSRGSFISIRLVGTASNRDGIGARVSVTADGRTQVKEVRSGSSFMSHGDLRVHFGLGRARKIDRIQIGWPSGRSDVVQEVDANQFLVAREGMASLEKRSTK